MLAGPTLRFTYATKFRDDLVGGRVPVDGKDVEIHGAPHTIHVVALPEAGRPPEFVDAVGTYTIVAEIDRREVEVGKPFRLKLRMENNGALATITRPRLDGLAGFHVYGAIDDQRPQVRTIVFDVAATRPRREGVPADPLRVLRPESAGRVSRRADAIDPPDGASGGGRVGRGGRGEAAPRAHARPRAGAVVPVDLGALVVLVIAGLTLRAKRRAQAAAAIDPVATRALAAGDAFRARVSHPDGDASEAFAEFLADRLGSTAAAVIGHDLGAQLVAAGAPEDLADHAAATLERLVAARYARAGARAEAAEGLETLVAALERALRPPRA